MCAPDLGWSFKSPECKATVETSSIDALLISALIAIHIRRSPFHGKKELRGLCPRANYTDRATAACQLS
jgi:hypothetical protein